MRAILLFITAIAFFNAQAVQQGTSDIARSVFQEEIKSSSIDPSSAAAMNEGKGGTPSPTVTPPKTTTGTAAGMPGANSINPGAAQGKKSQNMGAIVNMAAGAALLAACMATKPPNFALCAMGAQALAQGAADKGAAKESGATYNASQFDTGTNLDPASTTASSSYSDPTKGSGGFSNPKVAEGLAAMKEAGYTVTPAGVKTPDGTFVPSSVMGTSGAAAAFGAGAVREAEKVTAALNDEISKMGVSSVAVNTGAGGIGGGDGEGGVGESSSSDSSSNNGSNGMGAYGADRKRLMAGKTVNFDGEPIGVRGNNIFDMVHECYQKKRAGNHFIEGESSGSVRAPASVRPSSIVNPVRKK